MGQWYSGRVELAAESINFYYVTAVQACSFTRSCWSPAEAIILVFYHALFTITLLLYYYYITIYIVVLFDLPVAPNE